MRGLTAWGSLVSPNASTAVPRTVRSGLFSAAVSCLTERGSLAAARGGAESLTAPGFASLVWLSGWLGGLACERRADAGNSKEMDSKNPAVLHARVCGGQGN